MLKKKYLHIYEQFMSVFARLYKETDLKNSDLLDSFLDFLCYCNTMEMIRRLITNAIYQ